MLNTNVHVGGSHFNYHVNAVSGTLRKSHPKSKMIIRNLDTNSSLFDDEPKLYINRYVVKDIVICRLCFAGIIKSSLNMFSRKILRKGGEKMLKQYIFEVRRAGKKTVKVYNICHDDESAISWLKTQARLWDWGEHGLDWTMEISSRPLSQVYEHDGDKVGYLCEIVEELFARETSNNCPNTEFRGLSYIDLCEAAIEILEYLKGANKNETLS